MQDLSVPELGRILYVQSLREHLALFESLEALAPDVEAVAAIAVKALREGRKILFCGNGGSAADSQHLAAELVGRFKMERRALAAMALTTDSSVMTCVGNDYSFEDIFARQIEALGQAGDCLIVISTSGNSGNVLHAVLAGRENGLRTVGLLGRDGGKLLGLCEQSIVIPSHDTARIQEAHIMIGHVLCDVIERAMAQAPTTPAPTA